MCTLLLLTYDQHRDGRIVRTVIIVASYYQILVRIQVFQPGEDSIAFLKPGIASAVDAKRDETAFFQKGKTPGECFDAGRSLGGFCVIATGKIAKIKHNTADRFGLYIVIHVCMRFQKQCVILGSICIQKSLTCMSECLFLDIKGIYMTCFLT